MSSCAALRPLARTARHETAEHTRIEIGILHAEHEEAPRADDRRDGLGQRLRASVGPSERTERRQEHETLAARPQPGDEIVDAARGNEGRADVGIGAQRLFDLAFDRPVGLACVADDDDIARPGVELAHQPQVGADRLFFEHAGDLHRVELRAHARVVHP